MPPENIDLGTSAGNDPEFIDPNTLNGGNSGTADGADAGGIRDSAGNEFDGRIHASPDRRNRDGTFSRKRGRRAGFEQGKTKVHSSVKENAEFLAGCLMITHSMLAGMTQTPELMLEQSEAVDLSKATLELMAQYDFAPDPKIQAWITFGGCVGLTYGSRIVAIRSRKSQEKKERKPGVAGVYDADGAPNGTTTWRPNEWPIGEQNDNIGSVN